MERHDRTPVATFFADPGWLAGERVSLGEGVTHHVRVKRLAVGDPVRLTDGAGHLAVGTIQTIGRGTVDVDVEHVDTVAQPRAIHLRVPIADRDRMLWLAEKATELGIASWQAIRFRRSMSVTPRGEGQSFIGKVRARMINALEQSGGAWLPQTLPDASVPELTSDVAALRLLLDITGRPLSTLLKRRESTMPVVLVGPEGGIESDELSVLTEAGWRRVRLASTTLRFETAGIAAVAALRASHMLEEA